MGKAVTSWGGEKLGCLKDWEEGQEEGEGMRNQNSSRGCSLSRSDNGEDCVEIRSGSEGPLIPLVFLPVLVGRPGTLLGSETV